MTSDYRTPTSTGLPSAVERYARRESGQSPLGDAFAVHLREADKRGRRRARELSQAHSTTAPLALARAEGVAVVADDWSGMAAFTLLGSYADGTITVYDRQVREIAASLPLSTETARNVVVAHELGHHALVGEFASEPSGPLDSLRAVVAAVRGVGPRRERTLLVETAAHAFAGQLVDVNPLNHPLEVTELSTTADTERENPPARDRRPTRNNDTHTNV